MDDFTASAGLTRGALYHHFGDKKGLLQAVIAEIDGEMAARMKRSRRQSAEPLAGFRRRMHAYIEMALEPEIQRIVFRDGPAVLGDPSQWPNANACVGSMTEHLTQSAAGGGSRRRRRSRSRRAADQRRQQPCRAVDRQFERSRSDVEEGGRRPSSDCSKACSESRSAADLTSTVRHRRCRLDNPGS